MSWVEKFLSQPEGQFFVKIDTDFITETATKKFISEKFQNTQEIVDYICSNHKQTNPNLDQQARVLYGLVHQYYLLTDDGINQMIEKQKGGLFPKCPRTLCHSFTCVPVGSGTELKSQVRLFCPNCTDFYEFRVPEGLDGAYFGPDWVHFMMNKFPDVAPEEPPETFIPRVFGYKVHIPNANTPSSA